MYSYRLGDLNIPRNNQNCIQKGYILTNYQNSQFCLKLFKMKSPGLKLSLLRFDLNILKLDLN